MAKPILGKTQMHFLIRSVKLKDRDDLLDLAQYFPLCSLPTDKIKLENKIRASQESFKHIRDKKERNYMFVLEDTQKKKIIGSSQILSYFGINRSLGYLLEKKNGKSYLKLHRLKGQNEIGGLILHPDYRKSPALLGLQIGIVRFLYIKIFPNNFSPVVQVSLTAPIYNGKNYFWKETGFKYTKKNYKTALQSLQKNRDHFFSFFPKDLKIDVSQFSPSAKKFLTQVHPQAEPVYRGLSKVGFHKINYHHIIDGCIYMEAPWKKLSFLKKAKSCLLKTEKKIQTDSFLLAQQNKKGFFCTQVQGQIKNHSFLMKSIPKEFEKDEKALVLNFPF